MLQVAGIKWLQARIGLRRNRQVKINIANLTRQISVRHWLYIFHLPSTNIFAEIASGSKTDNLFDLSKVLTDNFNGSI